MLESGTWLVVYLKLQLSGYFVIIARMFMQINPTHGTKAKTKGKKQHHIHPKVLQLANALRDAESLWTVS